ncbi:MAG: hypothetical protein A2W91_02165 [Bacteroidetes bacterium GWF2_38_335]|nr:MAG: hypothetical protein A2W91_02165 [Bacteroidetes bacterium GWF2_38_335]OFY80657.1 MAG: hypothetical protein A2281_05180 [Bacteroidetes bacterium RIFOXYA12_FULL_38_20]HBS86999.1 peptidase M15 [Bacteroidales bacterium]
MRILILIALVFFLSCSEKENNKIETEKTSIDSVSNNDSVSDVNSSASIPVDHNGKIPDTSLVDITNFDDNIIFEMVYSSDKNFFKQKFYDCPKCYLRYEAALALYQVILKIKDRGYKLKIFDCFRPFSVQKKMWEVLPNRAYVADPARGGSIHNKGGAVDLTLADKEGNELNMGTEFDHFGPESAHSYSALDSTCISNRHYLKSVMEQCGFVALETEWWHYTFKSSHKYTNADLIFKCN